MSSSRGSSLGRMLALPGAGWCGSSFFAILGVLGGGTGMNSMEEEATQLESEVLRKRLRQPKESTHQESETMKTDLESAHNYFIHAVHAPFTPSLTERATTWQEAGGN